MVPVDRLLFMLKVVHTMRVSFRSGKLVCEPFLIVDLIAAIRRGLVIAVETSRDHQPGERNLRAPRPAKFHHPRSDRAGLAFPDDGAIDLNPAVQQTRTWEYLKDKRRSA